MLIKEIDRKSWKWVTPSDCDKVGLVIEIDWKKVKRVWWRGGLSDECDQIWKILSKRQIEHGTHGVLRYLETTFAHTRIMKVRHFSDAGSYISRIWSPYLQIHGLAMAFTYGWSKGRKKTSYLKVMTRNPECRCRSGTQKKNARAWVPNALLQTTVRKQKWIQKGIL